MTEKPGLINLFELEGNKPKDEAKNSRIEKLLKLRERLKERASEVAKDDPPTEDKPIDHRQVPGMPPPPAKRAKKSGPPPIPKAAQKKA